VLVVRDHSGRLLAFHNVCSHRSSKLMWCKQGQTRRIRCPYHSWTYDLDGSLVGVPGQKAFFDLDKSKLALTPIEVDAWEDFVFINLDANPSETLDEFLGDYSSAFRGYPFDEYTRVYEWALDVNCNWKMARDAFAESYHLPYLHSKTFGEAFSSAPNPCGDPLDFNTSKYHVQMSLWANLAYQPPPMELMSFMRNGQGLMDKTEKGGKSYPAAVNPLRAKNWSGDLNAFFPSLNLGCFPDFIVHINARPLAVDRCRLELRQAMRPPETASERWAQEVANVTFHTGVLEDIRTLENSQRVVGTSKKVMPLQESECSVRHQHLVNQEFAGPYPDA
jgi:phenylpropionate dioxygenase-like ring-hydroxylating dioxygenase large terminal subunit